MAAEVALLMTVLNYVLGRLPPALSQGLYFLLSLGLYPSLWICPPLSLHLCTPTPIRVLVLRVPVPFSLDLCSILWRYSSGVTFRILWGVKCPSVRMG